MFETCCLVRNPPPKVRLTVPSLRANRLRVIRHLPEVTSLMENQSKLRYKFDLVTLPELVQIPLFIDVLKQFSILTKTFRLRKK